MSLDVVALFFLLGAEIHGIFGKFCPGTGSGWVVVAGIVVVVNVVVVVVVVVVGTVVNGFKLASTIQNT